VEDTLPLQLNDPSGFDLIICRNVMIYFGPVLMRKIVRQFHECLAPGAWLLVGPSEPNMTCFTSFRAVNAPGVTLYQRPVGSAPGFAPGFAESFSFDGLPTLTPPKPIMPAPVVASPERAESAVPTLADLRQRADKGDWENAARCGKALLESDNLNAPAHFHYALVLEQMGNYAESERSFRKAIYLDRRAVLAHYHLGLLLRSHGDSQQAERCFHNALSLVATLSGAEILADADGITVADLGKMAQMQIENLRVRA
jgi:chemotaxis protein methyltransferase CheR